MAADGNLLGKMLRQHREKAGKTMAAVAIEAGIDRAYLWRIEQQPHDALNRPPEGTPPKQPSRDLVIRLAFALALSLDETDELLLIAGYAPLFAVGRFDHPDKSS